MALDPVLLITLTCVLALLVLFWRQSADQVRLRASVEQALVGQRADGESVRTAFQAATADTAARIAALDGTLRLALTQMQDQASQRLTTQFETTRAVLEAKLTEIQRGVNEQLHAAVEKQMTDSFARVIDQFTAVQKSMADVQAVTAQIADIKRLFGNVKTRGGWGETHVRAMLDDILPVGAYLTNHKVRADSDEAVEFAVLMPMRGEHRPVLPIDAKFPVEDYERLLNASEAGDVEAERAAMRALERRIRDEAKKIANKYILPPVTVEFAILYLPTDALYTEVARIPGLIDKVGREQRVLILGPSLFPALLHTIHLGFVTLALEQKADEIRHLLGATKTEMLKMDGVLERLLNQVGTFTRTIEQARTRTRAMGRKLREVEVLDAAQAEQLLDLDTVGWDAPGDTEEELLP
ncbi:MAG: DNA recombination protein RmuC [Acetobacteraceae bacterium]|nr:DNA recombination protein RmuC [Acetobacteraceae bacterium]